MRADTDPKKNPLRHPHPIIGPPLWRGPRPRAYTLEGYTGDAKIALDEGVNVRFTRYYSFLVGPTSQSRQSVTKSTSLAGPLNETARIDDRFAPAEGQASECFGLQPSLDTENVFLELSAVLTNSTPRRKGSFTLGQLGEFRFALRPCGTTK